MCIMMENGIIMQMKAVRRRMGKKERKQKLMETDIC